MILGDNISDRELDKLCADALYANRNNIVSDINKFTLKDTGRLISSEIVSKTESGISISYPAVSDSGVEYASFVFNNPRIHNVTTPGTTSFWLEEAENAYSMQWCEDIAERICISLENEIGDVVFG